MCYVRADKLFLLLQEECSPAFPVIIDCYICPMLLGRDRMTSTLCSEILFATGISAATVQ